MLPETAAVEKKSKCRVPFKYSARFTKRDLYLFGFESLGDPSLKAGKSVRICRLTTLFLGKRVLMTETR
jgi:hypothetical protein